MVTNGTGASTVNLSFTYEAVPTITGVAPASINPEGGETVVLTGTAFTDATAVTFGSTPATSFVINSATQITAVAPEVAPTSTHVTVTTPGGTSATGSGNVIVFAVDAVNTYTQHDGTAAFDQYFMDIAITPANLASGALVKRFDTVQYPEVGLLDGAKQGKLDYAPDAPVAVDHA